MEPIEILAIANAALNIYEKVAPLIAAKVAAGEISVEIQAGLSSRIDAIRSGAAFSAPHWQPSTAPVKPE